jgi:UDP-N-acetyl-2-amino-2-deoxyglucuronate dehydrogenase
MYPTVNGRKIRVGLAGCGRISGSHFDSFNRHKDDLELVAVCDINSESLEACDVANDVGRHTILEEMLKQEKLDLLSICTPSGTHCEQVLMAARRGVNVVTEKPMATRWKDGVKMVKACDEAGVRLFVVKQNRKNSTLQLLKRAINEGRFGKINMVHINVYWSRPQEYYDQARWRGTWELDGGALMNQASHYIDLFDWLIGSVDSIQAMTGTLGREIEVEDTGVMNIRWRNGALGSMSVTMLTFPKNYEGSITILGDRGTVRIGGVAVNEIQHWEFDEQRDYDADVLNANYETTSIYGFGHPLYYKNVIDVLRGDAEPETDGREGLKSLELIIAAYLSARDSRTISLPLEY